MNELQEVHRTTQNSVKDRKEKSVEQSGDVEETASFQSPQAPPAGDPGKQKRDERKESTHTR